VNIYIRIEIRRRELEGRLLLALAAAERGHDVLLGDLDALLSHRLWLRPGIFHDKSLTPTSGKIALHRRLAAAGFLVTSQDEEHGLGDATYDAFAQRRFGPETLHTATTAFCWGPHDRDALVEMYSEHADRFSMSGSPRVDLWRPEFRRRRPPMRPVDVEGDRPIVLVAPGSRPFIPHPFWVAMEDLRPRQFRSHDDDREWGHYRKFAEAYQYVGRLVRGIRLAAHAFPETVFVVRPHPKSPDGAWEAVLGSAENIIVTREGDAAGPWLDAARALIHNGSTTAAEAAMMGVPVVSFQPQGERSDRFTNRVGAVARDEDELLALIAGARDGRATTSADADRRVLEERLSVDPERLSADRIVDVWEAAEQPGLGRPNRLAAASAASRAHRRVGTVRAGVRRTLRGGSPRRSIGIDATPKFPPLTTDAITELADGLRRALGRFDGVDVTLVGRRLVRIRPR